MAATIMNTQANSRLFQLPQEIRDQIFTQHLLATSIGPPVRPRRPRRKKFTNHQSRRTPLAILYTCRRACAEIGESWLLLAVFVFKEPVHVLDTLASLPRAKLSQLRRVRVLSSHLVQLQCPSEDDTTGFRLVALMGLLPGLKLDRLSIVSCRVQHMSYRHADLLIRFGRGWKELRFLAVDSETLAYGRRFASENGPFRRRPQPSAWNAAMEEQDGMRCGGHVVVYRFKKPITEGQQELLKRSDDHICLQDWDPFEQPVPTPGSAEAQRYGTEADDRLLGPGEHNKPLLIVARRGDDARYEMAEDEPLVPRDVRAKFPGKAWPEIRAEAFVSSDESSDSEVDENNDEHVDIHNHINLATAESSLGDLP